MTEFSETPKTKRHEPFVIAIGSGKGGVGKTFFAVNLAIAIGQHGFNTVLVDSDLGGANVEGCMGMDCNRRIDDFFMQRGGKNIGMAVIPTYFDNVSIIAGASSYYKHQNPRASQKRSLIRHLKKMEADIVILDLGAGCDLDTLDMFLTADQQIVVMDGTRLSGENCLSFLRSVVTRKLLKAFKENPSMERALQRSGSIQAFQRALMDAPVPDDVKKRVIAILHNTSASIQPILVWNRVKNSMVKQTRKTICRVFENHGILLNVLDGTLTEKVNTYNLPSLPQSEKTKLVYHHYLEHLSQVSSLPNAIPEDPAASQSQEEGVPLLFSNPDTPAARQINEIALLIEARHLNHLDPHSQYDKLEEMLAAI